MYVAGDTENIPEMRALKNIDVAFIPMNLPYTMTPEEAADAVKAFKPKIVYPYHYQGTDLKAFEAALKGSRDRSPLARLVRALARNQRVRRVHWHAGHRPERPAPEREDP